MTTPDPIHAAHAEALCNLRDQDPNDDAAYRAALREAEQISPADLTAAAEMFDALAAGTFYARQDAAVRAGGGTPTYLVAPGQTITPER